LMLCHLECPDIRFLLPADRKTVELLRFSAV